MLQCFSLVYSYMLGFGFARCDLCLSHGLAGHSQTHSEASDVGACLWIWRGKGLRVWNVPSYMHLRQNSLPYASGHWFSHSALLSVTAIHATALDAYLFRRHRSTRRGTSFHRYQLGHKGGENVSARDQNYLATVQTGASSIVVTHLSVLQVCRLFMHLRIGVSVFFQLLGLW